MILEDKFGNVFNVEAVLRGEQCPDELQALSKALLQKVEGLEEELESAINCIEESGVDWEEMRSCY